MDHQKKPAEPSTTSATPTDGRRTYLSPVLRQYGVVSKLTQGSGGSKLGDGQSMTMQ